MTFTSKFTIDQIIAFMSQGQEKVDMITGVLFTKGKTMYELDCGDFLEEDRITSIYVKTSLREYVSESSGVNNV